MSNAELSFKKSITKKAFEKKLVTDFDVSTLHSEPYSENSINEDGRSVHQKLTLYYVNGNRHIATWAAGKGWIFKSAYVN